MDSLEVYELLKEQCDKYGIDPFFAHAVATAESDHCFLDKNGEIIVRFEPHVFIRYAKKRGLSTDIPTDKYGRSAMLKAAEIDTETAYLAASWGMFQIMGFNHLAAGYDNVFHYVDAMKTRDGQIKSFCEYCKSEDLIPLIKNKDYAKFAYRYNGPAYRQNKYDTKLASYYSRIKALVGYEERKNI